MLQSRETCSVPNPVPDPNLCLVLPVYSLHSPLPVVESKSAPPPLMSCNLLQRFGTKPAKVATLKSLLGKRKLSASYRGKRVNKGDPTGSDDAPELQMESRDSPPEDGNYGPVHSSILNDAQRSKKKRPRKSSKSRSSSPGHKKRRTKPQPIIPPEWLIPMQCWESLKMKNYDWVFTTCEGLAFQSLVKMVAGIIVEGRVVATPEALSLVPQWSKDKSQAVGFTLRKDNFHNRSSFHYLGCQLSYFSGLDFPSLACALEGVKPHCPVIFAKVSTHSSEAAKNDADATKRFQRFNEIHCFQQYKEKWKISNSTVLANLELEYNKFGDDFVKLDPEDEVITFHREHCSVPKRSQNPGACQLHLLSGV